MSDHEEKPVTVDARTKVPLGFYAVLVAACVYLVGSLESIRHRLDSIEEKLPKTWTLNDQLLFESQLRGSNRELNVPDSRRL